MAYHRAAPARNLAIHHANVIFGYRLADAAADIKAELIRRRRLRVVPGNTKGLTAGNRRLARFASPCNKFRRAGVDLIRMPQMRQHRDAGRWKFNDFYVHDMLLL